MKLKKFAFLILVRKIITRETDEVTNSCTVHKVYIPFISFMYPFIPFILFIYSPLFQEFQNCQANIDTHSLIFETDKTAISPPPYPKLGVSGNLLFQFLMICTTIMKLYKYVPTDVSQQFSLYIFKSQQQNVLDLQSVRCARSSTKHYTCIYK